VTSREAAKLVEDLRFGTLHRRRRVGPADLRDHPARRRRVDRARVRTMELGEALGLLGGLEDKHADLTVGCATLIL